MKKAKIEFKIVHVDHVGLEGASIKVNIISLLQRWLNDGWILKFFSTGPMVRQNFFCNFFFAKDSDRSSKIVDMDIQRICFGASPDEVILPALHKRMADGWDLCTYSLCSNQSSGWIYFMVFTKNA